MKFSQVKRPGFTFDLLLLCILGPIIIAVSGCSTEKNSLNALNRRDYLPDSYSTNFVIGGGSSSRPEIYARADWPSSPNALRAVRDENQRVYERSYRSVSSSSNGKPNDYFSYRIVTTSVK